MLPGLEEAREQWYRKMSKNRRSRREMARKLGLMKKGWQNIKDDFKPINKPFDLGISEFKRVLSTSSLSTSDKNKSVLQYKKKAYEVLKEILTSKEK